MKFGNKKDTVHDVIGLDLEQHLLLPKEIIA